VNSSTSSLVSASLTAWQSATFVALFAAVLSALLLPVRESTSPLNKICHPRVWLAIASICGYVAGVLDAVALAVLLFAWLLCEWHARVTTVYGLARALSFGAVVLAMLGLGAHFLPGFHNPLVLDQVVLSPGAEPYSLFLNFDKTVAGILLIAVCYRDERIQPTIRLGFGWLLALVAINVVVLIAASHALGYVRFDPKWTGVFWLWAAANLFSTCLSEEAFFRRFLLQEIETGLLTRGVHPRVGAGVALSSSALLFGLAHFAGGPRYVALATLAGLGYGYIYQRTRRIEWAMCAHFAMNAVHFLWFTYPRLG
jgi:uncharacterized protein